MLMAIAVQTMTLVMTATARMTTTMMKMFVVLTFVVMMCSCGGYAVDGNDDDDTRPFLVPLSNVALVLNAGDRP